ncbi:Nuclear envelope morphology protein 1, partial [Linnemannia elongata]
MLRRSSRFKSRSDLEEIAQSSTMSLSDPTLQLSSTSSSTLTPSSRYAAAAASVGSGGAGTLTPRNSSTFSHAGYGTDSMAEDGSGDNSTTRGNNVSEWYKLVIFTASMAEYADPVIDWLDQSKTLFDKRYFRQACFLRNGSYLKDLTVIDPDLSSVCLLDNSPMSYSLNKENGIPIDTWIDDPNDEALLDLLPFLDALRFTEDVRSVLSLRTSENVHDEYHAFHDLGCDLGFRPYDHDDHDWGNENDDGLCPDVPGHILDHDCIHAHARGCILYI